MADVRRLDGSHARQLEVLTGIASDLAAASSFVDRVLQGERCNSFPWWSSALVAYGRCFGRGVPPWGVCEAVNSLPEQLQSRHRHFRRLRDTLVSHPAGVDHTYRAEVIIDPDGRRRVQCSERPMFQLGSLDAMDFLELLAALQLFVERRLIEVRNELQADVAEISDEDLRQLQAIEPLDDSSGLRSSADYAPMRMAAR